MTETVRTIIVFLLTVGMTVRSMVPAGFMLTPAYDAESGAFRLVVCSASGHGLVTLDKSGEPIVPEPGKNDSSSCLYFQTSLLAIIAEVRAEALPTIYSSVEAQIPALNAVASRHELPDPARGPPSLSS